MNRKKIVIIVSLSVVLIIVLIVIALTTGGYMATILPQINDEMIETSNDKELENRLAEKEQFAKDHENQAGSSRPESETSISTRANSENTQFAEEAIEQENFINKVTEIMNRYYDDFETVTAQMEAESSGIQRIDVEEDTLSQASISFYDMILTVLEEQNLSQEDRYILIELISTLKYDIEKNDSLNSSIVNFIALLELPQAG